jgi:hypothetical protein
VHRAGGAVLKVNVPVRPARSSRLKETVMSHMRLFSLLLNDSLTKLFSIVLKFPNLYNWFYFVGCLSFSSALKVCAL